MIESLRAGPRTRTLVCRPSHLTHANLTGFRAPRGNHRFDRRFRVRVICEVRKVQPPPPVRMPALDSEVGLQVLYRTQSTVTKGEEEVLIPRTHWGILLPGPAVPRASTTDLTADHLEPQSAGGTSGPLRVLCRSCNARKLNAR
jgi:hypothetical protein